MRKPLFFICLLFPRLLAAQDAESPVPPASPFPLGPVLAEAFYGEGRWRPDWPPEIAPDAFTAEGALGVTVELVEPKDAVETRYGGIPYRRSRDSAGRLSAFPAALPLDSAEENPPALVFAQVEVRYGPEGGVLELDISAPGFQEKEHILAGEIPAGEGAAEGVPAEGGEAPAGTGAEDGESDAPEEIRWSVLFPSPQFPGLPPVREPAKVQCGESVFYALFSGGGDWIAETWYDPWGHFAAYFRTRLGPGDPSAGDRPENPRPILRVEGAGCNGEYRYESGGNLSESSGDRGFFSALYGERGRPLYWTAERRYGLQWNEEGRLTAMRDLDSAPAADALPGAENSRGPPAAFRYEYESDSRGNWIRRREIALFLRGNLLLPEYMVETVRRIEYPEED
ncbi:MAG: hypothetical protein LBH51_08420 [Treponema sp.]|jgi:YD repeat-containing protein|nr:hypothetical protein [Treponema sp.]